MFLKLAQILLWIGVSLYIIGTLMIIMHWFGGRFTRIAGYVLIGLPYIYLQWQKSEGKLLERTLGGLIFIWATFNIIYFLNDSHRIIWLGTVTFLSIGIWGIITIYRNFIFLEKRENQSPFFNWLNWGFMIGAAVLLVGALLLMLHWKYGRELLIAGLAIAGLSFILGLFLEKEEE